MGYLRYRPDRTSKDNGGLAHPGPATMALIRSTNSGATRQVRGGMAGHSSGQSRAASLIEAAFNVIVGYLTALALQIAVFPLFGIRADMADHVAIALCFTAVSLVRSFALRRLFQHIETGRIREREKQARSLEQRLATGRLS